MVQELYPTFVSLLRPVSSSPRAQISQAPRRRSVSDLHLARGKPDAAQWATRTSNPVCNNYLFRQRPLPGKATDHHKREQGPMFRLHSVP